jgi:hypothetical protein
MPETKIAKLSKADADIARAELLAVIAEETAIGTKYFEDTYKLHVRAGRAYWTAFLAVNGDDNAKPQTTEFATINNALGVTADKPFLGIRKLSTLSEDYIAFRAESVTANAFLDATISAKKADGGKAPASFRAIAPQLRAIVNGANGKQTTSNRKGSDEKVAAAEQLTHDKIVAWNYGFQGAYTGEDADGNAVVWTTADKNLVRGLLNRSHIDMAAMRAIPKDDVELIRALMNGILDDVKANGPTPNIDKDADDTDIERKVNSRSKSKAK